MACLALGTLGSILPDLDADSSAPARLTFNLAAAALAFLAMFILAARWSSLAELAVVWVAAFLLARGVLFAALARVTVHRGMLHSLPAAACFGLAATATAYRGLGVSPGLAWALGASVAGGYAFHLVLDEVYAVNLFGARTRRSLGSALKLWSRRAVAPTVALYLAAVAAFLAAPDPAPLVRAVSAPALRAHVARHLWPREGWFSAARWPARVPAPGSGAARG